MFSGKVFGIGWHKTATTSLQQALDDLGFKGKHWPYKMMDEIIKGHSRFKILEQYQSLTDFPVPLIFERLDKGYPESKFILTVRNSEEWAKSIEKHFELMDAPSKRLGGISINENLSRRGIPHELMHLMAYKQTSFSKEIFIKAYERHNEDVLAYFKDRPDDLLVMDMTKGDGWDLLCPFLGVPVPSHPYPVKHASEERVEDVLLPFHA